MSHFRSIFVSLTSLLIIAFATVVFSTAVVAHSGGGGDGGGGNDRDSGSIGNTEGDKPPGGFGPSRRPPPSSNDPTTAPYGQVLKIIDGTVYVEPPPGRLDWKLKDLQIFGSQLDPNKTWDFKTHPELVFALGPQWALHNLSLLLQSGKMSLAEYGAGLAAVMGLPDGTKMSFANPD